MSVCPSRSIQMNFIEIARHMQKQPHELFAGYKVPHPLEHSFVLKVQTDRTTTPTESLQRGVDQLIGDLSLLEERLNVPSCFLC
jgi:DNA-directed RNA polymerase II subunit RPB11